MPSAAILLLEVNIVSAHDLAHVCRNMRTYAVAWVHPNRKLSTRVETHGHTSPTWNDKFVFRVDHDFLYAETSSMIMVEIYAQHWFKDVHVGIVRAMLANLIPPPDRLHVGMQFVALQVRRRSGRPQGILNIGVTVLDSSKDLESVPLYTTLGSALGYNDSEVSSSEVSSTDITQNNGVADPVAVPKLRRSLSDSGSSMVSSDVLARRNNLCGNDKPGSVVLGSEVGLMTKKGKASSMVNVAEASKGKASSMVNGSVVISKGKRGRKARSMVNGTDVISKGKRGKASSIISVSRLRVRRKKGKGGSITNGSEIMDPPPEWWGTRGSIVFGSQPQKPFLQSDGSELGPSASEVAAAIAYRQPYVAESEILGTWNLETSEEGLRTKVERWRRERPPVYDRRDGGYSSREASEVSYDYERSNSDDGACACSCFVNICGLECTVVCGGHPSKRKRRGSRRHGRSFSESYV